MSARLGLSHFVPVTTPPPWLKAPTVGGSVRPTVGEGRGLWGGCPIKPLPYCVKNSACIRQNLIIPKMHINPFAIDLITLSLPSPLKGEELYPPKPKKGLKELSLECQEKKAGCQFLSCRDAFYVRPACPPCKNYFRASRPQ